MAQYNKTFQLAKLSGQLNSPEFSDDSAYERGQAAIAEIPVIRLVEMYLSQFDTTVRQFIDKVDVTS
jgi:hypothetical protein